MPLSNRAKAFLQKSKRDNLSITEQDIRKAFINNKALIFESLIHFQLTFGGYIFYAGLEPIKFSLLKSAGGYPKSTNTCVIEFEKSDLPSPKYFFDCTSTNYQMQFFLDENGAYYEDYEAKASSFEKLIEHLALWDEISRQKAYKILFRNKSLKTESVDKLLNLAFLPEASDQYTLWFKNEFIYMEQWQGLTTLIASEKFPDKNLLLTLESV